MRVRSLCVIVAAATPSLLTAPALAQDPQTRALELFRAGNEAFASGRTHRAYAAYREAWSLSPSYDIACNLGRAEAELGKARDAAEHLDFCLSHFAASSQPEHREAESRFRELLARVRLLVGRVVLRVRPAGAEVLLDGITLGPSPLPRPLYVEPGPHSVEARLPGYGTMKRDFNAGRAEQRFVEIVLERARAAPVASRRSPHSTRSTAPRASAPRPSAEASARIPLLIGGASLTLATLAASSYFAIRAHSSWLDADELRQDVASGGCSGPRVSICERLRETNDDEARQRNLADVGFIAAAVIGSATVATWLLWPTSPTASVSRIGIQISSDTARLHLQQRF
jgi:hypothetical protein